MGTHELHNTSPQAGMRLVKRRCPCKPGDGAAAAKPNLSPELLRCLRACAEGLIVQFPEELGQPALSTLAGQFFARLVRPKVRPAGRRRSPAVDSACELLKQGVPWRQVPWKVLPGFAEMSRSEQSFERDRLRRAIYMRQKRAPVTNQKLVS